MGCEHVSNGVADRIECVLRCLLIARRSGAISNLLKTTIGTPWRNLESAQVLSSMNREYTCLVHKLAAEAGKPEDMEERHNKSDNGLRFKHPTKALRLLEQIGHDVLMCQLHSLHET